MEALEHVKEQSIIFNKEVFGRIFKRKRKIEARIKRIQRTLERVDSLSLLHLEQALQHEFNHILFQEELLWFQKSRENWVKLGDKNTAYFHAQTVKGFHFLMVSRQLMRRYSNMKLKSILRNCFALIIP